MEAETLKNSGKDEIIFLNSEIYRNFIGNIFKDEGYSEVEPIISKDYGFPIRLVAVSNTNVYVIEINLTQEKAKLTFHYPTLQAKQLNQDFLLKLRENLDILEKNLEERIPKSEKINKELFLKEDERFDLEEII